MIPEDVFGLPKCDTANRSRTNSGVPTLLLWRLQKVRQSHRVERYTSREYRICLYGKNPRNASCSDPVKRLPDDHALIRLLVTIMPWLSLFRLQEPNTKHWSNSTLKLATDSFSVSSARGYWRGSLPCARCLSANADILARITWPRHASSSCFSCNAPTFA